MTKGRISDWVNEIEKFPNLSDNFSYKDNKVEDQRKLRDLDLPVPEILSTPIANMDAKKLNDFFEKYPGLFLRVIPDESGLKKGLKKKYTFGYYKPEYFLNFIKEAIETDPSYKHIEFQEWDEDIFGWILISNGEKVIAEISQSLDNLSHHNEIPLSSLIAENEDFKPKITWIKKDSKFSAFLEKALRLIVTKTGQEFFIKGYFEGLTTKEGKNFFFDYKQNPLYYNF